MGFPWKQSPLHPQRFRVTLKWVFHFWMIEPNLFIWRQNIVRSSLAIYGNGCKVFRSICDLNSILKSSENHQKSSESCPKVAQCWGRGSTSLPVIWSRFKSWTSGTLASSVGWFLSLPQEFWSLGSQVSLLVQKSTFCSVTCTVYNVLFCQF